MTDITSPLGQPVPPYTAHAISVSLPTWRDNVGYEEGEKRVADAMVNGYPRFYIHKSIQKLAEICEKKFGVSGEQCLLFPSMTVAEQCREFIERRSAQLNVFHPRITQFVICPEDNSNLPTNNQSSSNRCIELHVVLFPEDAMPLARQFWQHTGMGISSRLADRCLSMLSDEGLPVSPSPPSPSQNRFPSKSSNRHYSVKVAPPLSPTSQVEEASSSDFALYVEERYGRNLPTGYAEAAKRTLRRRIAGVLVHDADSAAVHPNSTSDPNSSVMETSTEIGPSTRAENLDESDVFLFPTGMAAIWSAHNLALRFPSSHAKGKSVCFGFPYTDTLKILEKWGPGCHFFGHGHKSDIDALEELLQKQRRGGSEEPPILALFTEFPSNPLLRSPDLPRLRQLADEYNFLIVVDETVGNFVNVSVLSYADIVASSLTKVFSGDSNVMGGSLILNPNGWHYTALKSTLESIYEDNYFNEDAIFLERNSRLFRQRIQTINENAETICDFLHSRRHHNHKDASKNVIKEVFYPKYTTRENYEKCRNMDGGVVGFGGLFSVTFTTKAASECFFDALRCYKGPSLGTSFTLACPFVVLAHYAELEWAAGYGVEEGLVRVSVGTESREDLVMLFEDALRAAEQL